MVLPSGNLHSAFAGGLERTSCALAVDARAAKTATNAQTTILFMGIAPLFLKLGRRLKKQTTRNEFSWGRNAQALRMIRRNHPSRLATLSLTSNQLVPRE